MTTPMGDQSAEQDQATAITDRMREEADARAAEPIDELGAFDETIEASLHARRVLDPAVDRRRGRPRPLVGPTADSQRMRSRLSDEPPLTRNWP